MKLSDEERLFLAARPETEALYAVLREKIEERLGPCGVEVHRTQISLKKRYGFAAVSFAPVRCTAERPKSFLTLSLSLRAPLDSLRVAAAVQISQRRWMHHFMLSDEREIDEELLGWIAEAANLAEVKR